MIKQYYLNYDCGMAKIKIEVDTNILTTEAAKEILDFYDIFCLRDSWAIRAVVKMCAMDVIKAGVLFGNNLPAIKKYIKENNELDLLDDKSGIKIIDFKPFQFEEVFLDIEDLDSEDIEDIEE